jgi:hypothetical protein
MTDTLEDMMRAVVKGLGEVKGSPEETEAAEDHRETRNELMKMVTFGAGALVDRYGD